MRRTIHTSYGLQHVQALTTVYLPYAYCMVTTATGKIFPIGAKGDGVDPAGVPPHHLKALAAIDLPGAEIIPTSGNDLPIWAKGNGMYTFAVSLENPETSTATRFPQAHTLIFSTTDNRVSILSDDR